MLSTIFYKINTAAANLRKNVEEAFTPKTPVITSTEPVFITNTTTASPTLEHTPVTCETVEPTISPKLMRKNSIMNIEENACSGDCANCDCKATNATDVEDCGKNAALQVDLLSITIPRICSKSACDCITTFDINCDKTEKCIDDISGNCYNGNNECCQDE